MSGDLDLIKQLEREIGTEIEVRPDRSEEEDHAFGKERPKSTDGNTNKLMYWFFLADQPGHADMDFVVIDEDGHAVRLYLMKTLLSEVPSTLFKLEYIELLLLYRIKFSIVPAEIRSLSRLRMLFFGSNKNLRELPRELAQLPQLDETCFDGLQLTSPPQEIAEQGIDAIQNYFASLDEADEVDYLYEAKMVLVGRGFAGKTSLVRRLTIPGYKLEQKIKSTEGIAIATWDLKMPLEKSDEFRFNIWDFGGQEKYDATHQFFITERTVYLFVTEARQESNYLDFDYWLNVVQILGKESPVIVVQNKVDLRKKSLPTSKYSRLFPNIVGFVDVSCADDQQETIAKLRDCIQEAVRKLPQVGDKLPGVWVKIREELNNLEKDYITYDEYCQICAAHGLSETRADHLSRYFHDLGVIVHHSDDPLLKKLVVVNSDWAIDGVYNVLDTPSIEHRNGRFTNSDLEQIWSEAKYAGKRPELLALMKNYKICFELPGTGTYIAPELLTANPVAYDRIEKTGRLTFVYRYQFMPAGLISRLIVKLHRHIEGEAFWRHGVVVTFEGARALVVEDDQARQIRIDVEGNADTKRELLAIIRKEFFEIYEEFNRKIEYEERIPCNCRQCLARIEDEAEPHYFDWRTVQRYAREPIDVIRCEASLAEVSVPKLMGEIADKPDAVDDFSLATRQRTAERPTSTDFSERAVPKAAPWEKVALFAVSVSLVLVMLVIAFLVPEPTEFQIWVFRVVLALGAAGVGALIPGFLEFEYRNWLRAGGAAAFFALVYLVNPPGLIHDPPAAVHNNGPSADGKDEEGKN